MIYVCSKCRKYTFEETCRQCDGERGEYIRVTSPDETSCVPLHPRFYPDFRYSSQGFLGDLLHKRKETARLQSDMGSVLEKYERFRTPYFVNLLHILRARSFGARDTEQSDVLRGERLRLFKLVLDDLGFDELVRYEELAERLLLTTQFSFEYAAFSQQIEAHIKDTLDPSLAHWIEERGAAFRRELPLFLYYAWENERFASEIPFQATESSEGFVPLVSRSDLEAIERRCEEYFLRNKVVRFRGLLENFDPARYLTIYRIDGMSGHEFEHFLASLFSSVGFDVEETRQTQDQGADLFARRFGRSLVIQAKRYSENVGNAAVQQAISAMQHFSCDGAMVVTNSYFTGSAKELADSVGVQLVDRDALRDMLEDYNQTLIEGVEAARTDTQDAEM